MLDFHPLTTKELIKVGIVFDTKKEGDQFAEIVQSDLEIRIGARISEGKTEAQLEEFDCCKTQEEATNWLRKNCPEYKEIVSQITERMEEELVAFRDRIPGNVFCGGIPIRALGLDLRSFHALRRAGLDTVEKVMAADLSKIRNLSANCREEIWEKLWDLYYMEEEEPPAQEDGEESLENGPHILGSYILHPNWGRGKVIEIDKNKPYKYVILEFQKEGQKKLGFPWFAKRCKLVC